MFQFDQATIATLCFIGFLILAPLSVCGIFALSEHCRNRRMRRKRPLRTFELSSDR